MTAEEIVRKLTKAQREALTRWPHSGQVWAYADTMRVLERFGLVADRICGSGWGKLSPIGFEVQRRLLENTHD